MDQLAIGGIVLIFSLVAAALSYILLLLSQLISTYGNKRYDPAMRKKEHPFECGLNPTEIGHTGCLSIHYFLIAAAFLIFELEGTILLSWAINYWTLGFAGVVTAVVFILILLLGLVYMFAKGALTL